VVRVNRFAAAHWAGYVERLRAAAEAVGADFVDLNTTPLEGWCFVDRVHMNDRGHRLVAEPILELLA
jgi:lysophospholipase L1-like esterase